MYSRLMSFLNKYDVLFQCQYGFRQGHSTSTAILQLVQNINESINKKDKLLAVFIDLSKAFDIINHNILISKLSHYGIRGLSLQWFQSYLDARQQFTLLNGNNSEHKPVECGVPQGSILGPLLFLIYVNDIQYCSNLLRYILFADDTCIYLSGNTIDSLISTMNIQLQLIDNWMQANDLILNIEKTKFMIFGNYRNDSFKMYNYFIEIVLYNMLMSLNF